MTGDRREPIFQDALDRQRFLKASTQRPPWLRVDRLFGELGIQRDDAAGRRRFAEAVEQRRRRVEPGEWKALRRGWMIGGAERRQELLERMGQEVGQHHGGGEIQETEQQRAELLVRQELQKRRWTESDLKQRRKTDAGKVRIAAWLRRETVMTLEWIAARLQMGSRYTLANCFKEFNKGRD